MATRAEKRLAFLGASLFLIASIISFVLASRALRSRSGTEFIEIP